MFGYTSWLGDFVVFSMNKQAKKGKVFEFFVVALFEVLK